MDITHSDIKKDVEGIKDSLSKADVQIPSLWRSSRFGFLVMFFLMSWQFLICFISASENKSVWDEGLFPMFISFFMGVLFIIVTINFNGKYLALPCAIRSESIILKMLKRKVTVYSSIWVFLNVSIGLVGVLAIGFGPSVQIFSFLFTSVIIFAFFQADVSRYDLSVISSIISAWHRGKVKEV